MSWGFDDPDGAHEWDAVMCEEEYSAATGNFHPDEMLGPPPPEESDIELPLSSPEKPSTRTGGSDVSPTALDISWTPSSDLCSTASASTPSLGAADFSPVSGSAQVGSATISAEPRRRRTRLLGKTPVADTVYASLPGTGEPAAPGVWLEGSPDVEKISIKFLSISRWEQMTRREKFDWCYDKVRNYWTRTLNPGEKQRLQSLMRHEDLTAGGRHQDRRLFKVLGPLEKRATAERFTVASSPPRYIASEIDLIFPAGPSIAPRNVGHTVLLTYMGPWGLRSGEPAAPWVQLHPLLTMDDVVEMCGKQPQVDALWEEMVKYGEELKRKTGCHDIGMCLELCPQKLEVERAARLHMHIFLRASGPMRLPPLPHIHFQGVVPVCGSVIGGMPLARKSNSWAGYFYCVCPKVGSVKTYGNRRAYTDFLVDSRWVFNLLQAGKVRLDVARDLVVRGCHNSKRLLDELAVLDREAEKVAIRKAKQLAEQTLGRIERPFKVYSIVEEWKSQYTQVLHRYRFLVLCGPSRLGKTQFAKSLVEPAAAETHECNCAAGAEPDLRDFRYHKHKLVLFDEIEPAAILSQRKLFQASASEVQLGCSATN